MRRLLIATLALLSSSSPVPTSPASERGILTIDREVVLPPELTHALDLRWWAEDELLIASDRQGTVRLQLGDPPSSARFWPGGDGAKLRSHWRVGLGRDRIVVAAPLFSLLHGPRGGGDVAADVDFEFIEDLDIHGTRLAVLGTRRAGGDEPERGIVWQVRLDRPGSEPEPLVFSGRGRNSLDACGAFEIGAVRFLADGSLVAVPGTEPDVYLFAPDGRLRRTWQTDRLEIDSRCPLSREETELLSRDQPARWHWLARRRTVDEILPLPGGEIGLVVRDATGREEGTRWHLLRLAPDGSVDRFELPFRSPHGEAFVRGDVREGEIALLIGRRWSGERPLDGPPRLLVGTFRD